MLFWKWISKLNQLTNLSFWTLPTEVYSEYTQREAFQGESNSTKTDFYNKKWIFQLFREVSVNYQKFYYNRIDNIVGHAWDCFAGGSNCWCDDKLRLKNFHAKSCIKPFFDLRFRIAWTWKTRFISFQKFYQRLRFHRHQLPMHSRLLVLWLNSA